MPPTPDGWVVVEWGDLRLSVPPEMSPFTDPAACTQESLTLDCSALGFSIRRAVDPGFVLADDDVTVNGLQQARFADGVLVRDLVLDVQFFGAPVDQVGMIADTVGVSSRWRATNEPAPPVPDGWRAVGFDNVQVRVPDEWPSVTIDPAAADPDICGFRGMETAATFERGGAVASCVDVPPVVPPSDGVRIYELRPGESVSNPPGYPYREQAFEVPSDGRTYVVRVGFGVDGTIGRTILGSLSIHRVVGGAVGPVGPVGEVGLPVPPTPDGWQLVEWGDVRLSLPPELDPRFGAGCDIDSIRELVSPDVRRAEGPRPLGHRRVHVG